MSHHPYAIQGRDAAVPEVHIHPFLQIPLHLDLPFSFDFFWQREICGETALPAIYNTPGESGCCVCVCVCVCVLCVCCDVCVVFAPPFKVSGLCVCECMCVCV
jgi:hypothetical protein